MKAMVTLDKAFILAGGKGTRLSNIIKDIPKSLVEVQGKPVLTHIILHLKKQGVKTVILSLGYLGDRIKEHYDKNPVAGVKMVYIFESPDNPLGTAGPLRLIKDLVKSPFIMLNGDTLSDVDMKKFFAVHKKNKALATLVLKELEDTTGRGTVRMDGERIVEFVEKAEPGQHSNCASIGVYVINPEVIDLIPTGKQTSIEKEIFPLIAKQGRLFGFNSKPQYFDIGTPERLEIAIKSWKPSA
jgi:NDP-sugar pyrophosphorylase family protein